MLASVSGDHFDFAIVSDQSECHFDNIIGFFKEIQFIWFDVCMTTSFVEVGLHHFQETCSLRAGHVFAVLEKLR